MQALMQSGPLLVSAILRHAARHHGGVEVVSRVDDTAPHRTTYRVVEARARRLAGALHELGVRPGEKVATLAWNGVRHLELYYAIAGMGAVCHTVNPRLGEAVIAAILAEAGDRIVVCEPMFTPLLGRVLARSAGVVRVVVTLGEAEAVPGLAMFEYETLMAAAAAIAEWPALDERTACGLCYTSGTTGRPRGVLYSHRSTVLHAMAINGADAFAMRAADRVLPAVPMFHVNAWGLPYAAPMAGAALVLPGRRLDGASLCALMRNEAVTFAAGVPTVWQSVLAEPELPASLRRVVVGGAACPRPLLEAFEARGVRVVNAWGMTETSPAVACNSDLPQAALAAMDPDAATRQRLKVGRVLFGADLRVVDASGQDVPPDGASQGELHCRGHWVAERYFGEPETALRDGWLPTGDVGTIDEHGFVEVTDRARDMIKSGGEWISSVRLEEIALAHPDVAEAAVIAAAHPKWIERPLLIVAFRPGRTVEPEALLGCFDGLVPSWWRPDAVSVLAALPHGPTGKVLKAVLRASHGDTFVGDTLGGGPISG